MTPLPQEKLSR
uniref:Uncharacterized protein n=1 Tax=Arundo donax TaxID=35708 RepID=A0A0A8YL82_ARUDO